MSCCFKIEFFPGEREREKEKEVSTEHTSGARVVSANNNKERARGKNVKHQYASRLKARLPKFNFLSLPSLWGRRHGNFRDTNFSRSLSLAALQSHKTRRSQTDDEFWKRLVDENDGGVKSTRVYIILTSPPAKPDMSRITSRW